VVAFIDKGCQKHIKTKKVYVVKIMAIGTPIRHMNKELGKENCQKTLSGEMMYSSAITIHVVVVTIILVVI